MKSKTFSLAVIALALSVSMFSCSSSSKDASENAANSTGDSFPHSQFWNCVVKSRGKTFYGRAGSALEARAQAFEQCESSFKKNECAPVLCELKSAD